MGDVEGWHCLEYGPLYRSPLNNMDTRERYVYTFLSRGDEYKFYTKILNNRRHNELILYLGKAAMSKANDESKEGGTVEEKIHLHTV